MLDNKISISTKKMIHVPFKKSNNLIRPAVTVESRGTVLIWRKRQLKPVCTAQRPPSHQHRESM